MERLANARGEVLNAGLLRALSAGRVHWRQGQGDHGAAGKAAAAAKAGARAGAAASARGLGGAAGQGVRAAAGGETLASSDVQVGGAIFLSLQVIMIIRSTLGTNQCPGGRGHLRTSQRALATPLCAGL
jgi:hypothetical protein